MDAHAVRLLNGMADNLATARFRDRTQLTVGKRYTHPTSIVLKASVLFRYDPLQCSAGYVLDVRLEAVRLSYIHYLKLWMRVFRWRYPSKRSSYALRGITTPELNGFSEIEEMLDKLRLMKVKDRIFEPLLDCLVEHNPELSVLTPHLLRIVRFTKDETPPQPVDPAQEVST